MNNLQKWTSLLGRIFLSAVFIKSGIGKILDPASTQQYMASAGIPGWLLIPTIAVLLIGGLSVLVGYKARYGALLLIGFLIPSTLIFHNLFADPSQEIAFMKNLGLIGGLLIVYSFGPGSISFDGKNINYD
ncbi:MULTISPECIES: DoxX family protein [unclassified Okeania]|uniref:DoxX family protein n=1 Tax=unclassified Okeania TaxID=2634635 RepID=UPI0013B61BC4|nr:MULTISPECIES: DoxX family protein [unclassified Okeania]NES77019.1 DoxX family protein [Okeania sp. SIO1H4]NET12036.1 DoxX family protein [Okeania sp. SIO1H6]NET18514.1 DoxX family protein [Okeania sp. SIO1H5]NET92625.1 DoxX family protein [Okeania sp. SIO1H2]